MSHTELVQILHKLNSQVILDSLMAVVYNKPVNTIPSHLRKSIWLFARCFFYIPKKRMVIFYKLVIDNMFNISYIRVIS